MILFYHCQFNMKKTPIVATIKLCRQRPKPNYADNGEKLNYADNGHNTRRGQNVPDIPKMEKNGPKMDQKKEHL